MPSRVDGECNSRAAGKLLFVLTRALVYLGIIGRKWRRDLEGGLFGKLRRESRDVVSGK